MQCNREIGISFFDLICFSAKSISLIFDAPVDNNKGFSLEATASRSGRLVISEEQKVLSDLNVQQNLNQMV